MFSPDLKSLSQLVTSTKANEWLYVETKDYGYSKQNVFKTTNGYFDKFCLCLKDLFTGFTLAQKTQDAVNRVLTSCEGINPGKLQEEPFKHASSIAAWNSSIETFDKAKIKLVWNNKLTVIRAIDSLSECLKASFFLPALKKLRALVDIIPPGCFNGEKIAKLFQEVKKAYEKLESIDLTPYLERSVCWVKVVETLKDLKLCLRGEQQIEEDAFDSLDSLPWRYYMGPWSIYPSSNLINTAANSQKRIDSLIFDFNNEKIIMAESSNPEQLAEKYTEILLSFFKTQRVSQRCPIQINFTQPRLNPLSKKFPAVDEILEPLIRKTMSLLEKHPEYFLHRTSLYEEGNNIPNADKQKEERRKCLSHLSGYPVRSVYKLEKIYAVPCRPLREGIKQVIQSLRQQGCTSFNIDLNEAVSFSTEASIARKLQALEEGRDFIISSQGKDYGCHRKILYEAFPYLQAQMSGSFSSEGGADRLNLDQILPLTQLPVNCGEWVLNALVGYAYTTEHPNLPENITMETREAYRVYLTYIDFLNPLRELALLPVEATPSIAESSEDRGLEGFDG